MIVNSKSKTKDMKLFTVGPVQMFEDTLNIASKQLPYFRTPEFSAIMLETDDILKRLINAPDRAKSVYLTASGTGAMEAAVINCFDKSDKLLVISGGSFGQRFEEICEIHGFYFESLSLPFGEALIREHLDEFDNKGFTGLLVNVHETSTGQLYDIKLLSDFCKRNDMYLIVDAISSVFADEYNMQKSGIDVTIFSSQKALSLSPGISVVILSERIYENKVKNINVRSLYFDFKSYIKNIDRGQTPFTPAVGTLLEMYDMLNHIEKMGIDKKILQTKALAHYFRKNFIFEGIQIPYYPLSNALTPILFNRGALKIYEMLKSKYDIILTPTGGELSDKLLRVGHIGNLNEGDIDNLIEKLNVVTKRI